MGPRLPPGVPPARRACAQRCPGVSLHAFTATATARVRRDIVRAARPARSGRAGRIVRSAEPALPRAAARRAQDASCCDVLSRHRGRRRHHLLHVAPRGGRAGGVAGRGRRPRAVPITPGSTTRRGTPTRTRSSTSASTSSSPPSRSAWASTDPTSDSSSTPARRSRSSTISRKSGRAGRDGLEAECVLISSAADFLKWREMLEQNGELTEARHAAPRHGALRGQRRVPAPAPGQLLRRDLHEGRLRRVRLLPGRARGGGGSGHSRAQDPVVRGAGRATFRRRPRRPACSAATPATQCRSGVTTRFAVRPAEGPVDRRDSRLHRAAHRARAAAADRRAVPGIAADRVRRRAVAATRRARRR